MCVRGDDVCGWRMSERRLSRCEGRHCDEQRECGPDGTLCWLRVKDVLLAYQAQNNHLAKLRLRTCQTTAEANLSKLRFINEVPV